jgi:rhamnosyl/mannosyltransferase
MPQPLIKTLTLGRLYPPSYGGIERHIDLLLEGLSRDIQADCIVVNEQFKSEIVAAPNRMLYKIPALGTVASTPICPTLPYWVRKLHKANRYDIVHLHFPNPMAHLAAYVLPRNVKLVITWHSDIIRQKNLLTFYQPFLKHIVQRADVIIAGTPKSFDSFKQLNQIADPKKFYVVPFAINTAAFLKSEAISASAIIREKYPAKNIIFAIGRHVYYKGFEYLIRAMAQVDNAILLLGGAGPLTADLKNLAASLNINHKIDFLGYVAEEQLPAYHHAADIFCMPSVEQSEAFGLVQLEAMACKKPVICCELNNGVSYVNQNGITGLVVPPRDVSALAGAINQLLSEKLLAKQMGEAGYNRVLTQFSLEKMWQDTLDVYKTLLRN